MLEKIIVVSTIGLFALIALGSILVETLIEYLTNKHDLKLITLIKDDEVYTLTPKFLRVEFVVLFHDGNHSHTAIMESDFIFLSLNYAVKSLVVGELLRRHGYMCSQITQIDHQEHTP